MEVRHFLLFDDAGFEAAAPALGLVVEDAMLLSVGEPDARFVARGEDGHARGLHGGGEVHGAAVMTDEDCVPAGRRQRSRVA